MVDFAFEDGHFTTAADTLLATERDINSSNTERVEKASTRLHPDDLVAHGKFDLVARFLGDIGADWRGTKSLDMSARVPELRARLLEGVEHR